MAVIEPTRGKKERKVPSCGLMLVNPQEASTYQEKLLVEGGRRQFLFNSKLVIDTEESFFIAGPAVGAPVAVMALEKLVALGARQLVLCGWCGAISPELTVGDVLVPDSARIGEGTSQYYGKNGDSTPSCDFSGQLADLLLQENLPVSRGRVWSTDGIFREERSELLALYKEHEVVAVDMEFSALCSAAAFRGIQFAGVLVVSDITTGERWQPGFSTERFRKNRKQVLDIIQGNVAQIKRYL